MSFLLAALVPLSAHDLEQTRVVLTFLADGSFVAEVSNDTNWLTLRTQSIRGPFVDRVVLWVDGREIRPDRTELIAGAPTSTYRLRGRVPVDSRTLRWFYGLVADPYPLTIRRADGRTVAQEIAGNAWSREIDLRGQFNRQARWPTYVIAALFAASAAAMFRRQRVK